jgi:hypothetical protein
MTTPTTTSTSSILTTVFGELARAAASKVVGGLVALGVAAGIVIPLDESAALTATLTLVISTVLGVLWQLAMAYVEKRWPNLAILRPTALRAQLTRQVAAQTSKARPTA